ncbi:MAG: AAA family ATPase [Desulfobacterales bacterium]|nr:AAA family ATPase [Desulfobacterales bacterium]
MYLEHYRLTQKPFQINTDPEFLWLGEKHREALATLQYGLLENKSFLLLTGDVGVGKTTIVNAFLQMLDKNDQVAVIHNPVFEPLDFFNYLAKLYGLSAAFETKGDFLNAFNDFLSNAYYQGRRVVLIIDECQLLSPALMEEIRLFSNIEKKGTKLINIFFVGQLEFNDILLRPENRAIRQRIEVNFNILPLSLKETQKYIEYRLSFAGATRKIFKASAIRKIYRFSKGYPRLINIIADRALLTGFIKSARKIKKGIVKECVKEIDLSSSNRKTQNYDNSTSYKSVSEKNDSPVNQETTLKDANPKTEAVKAFEKFASIDEKKFREKMDDLNIKRSNGVRLLLNRIHQGALDPNELISSGDSESKNIFSRELITELERIRHEVNDESIRPLLDLLVNLNKSEI